MARFRARWQGRRQAPGLSPTPSMQPPAARQTGGYRGSRGLARPADWPPVPSSVPRSIRGGKGKQTADLPWTPSGRIPAAWPGLPSLPRNSRDNSRPWPAPPAQSRLSWAAGIEPRRRRPRNRHVNSRRPAQDTTGRCFASAAASCLQLLLGVGPFQRLPCQVVFVSRPEVQAIGLQDGLRHLESLGRPASSSQQSGFQIGGLPAPLVCGQRPIGMIESFIQIPFSRADFRQLVEGRGVEGVTPG